MSESEEPMAKMARIEQEDQYEVQEEWLSEEALTDDEFNALDQDVSEQNESVAMGLSGHDVKEGNKLLPEKNDSIDSYLDQFDDEVKEEYLDTSVNFATEEEKLDSDVDMKDEYNSDDGHSTDDLLRMLEEEEKTPNQKMALVKAAKNEIQPEVSSEDEIFEGAVIRTVKLAKNVYMKKTVSKPELPKAATTSDSESSDDKQNMQRIFRPRKKIQKAAKSTTKGGLSSKDQAILQKTTMKSKKTTNTPRKSTTLQRETSSLQNKPTTLQKETASLQNKPNPSPNKGIGSSNRTITLRAKTTTVLDKPTTSSNKATPSPNKTPVLRSKTASLPTKTASLPTKTASLPTKTTSLPTKTTSLPTKTASLPTKSNILPTKTTSLPTKTTGLPSKATTLSPKTTTLPTKMTSLPEKIITVSKNAKNTPAKRKPLPMTPKIKPVKTESPKTKKKADPVVKKLETYKNVVHSDKPKVKTESEDKPKVRTESDESWDEEDTEYLDGDSEEDMSDNEGVKRPKCNKDEHDDSDESAYSLYDDIATSESDDVEECFEFDVRAERATDYLPMLGENAHKLLTDEKNRVMVKVIELRSSLDHINDKIRTQSTEIDAATRKLKELNYQLNHT